MTDVIRARVTRVVAETLRVDPHTVSDELAAGDVPTWDSLGHVTVLQALEQEFGLVFDIDDALAIESVGDMVEVLARLHTA